MEDSTPPPPPVKKPRTVFESEGVSLELLEFCVSSVLEKECVLLASSGTTDKNDDETPYLENATLNQSLSARERNRLKRKLRNSDNPCPSRSISIDSEVDRTPPGETGDHSEGWIFDGVWPFVSLYNSLMEEVLDPVWEVRHGAVMGLRELLSRHNGSIGIKVEISHEHASGWAVSGKSTLRDLAFISRDDIIRNEVNNRLDLERSCVKFLELLILDRMGDYLSDQMVAPVRETAAQALGACLTPLPSDSIDQLIVIGQEMARNESWEVRHSGFLLMKQILISRDSLEDDKVLKCVLTGLQDSMDDVRAAAADVLVPIAQQLNSKLSDLELTALRELLWTNLAEVDDLSAATPSILHLLWKLYLNDETKVIKDDQFSNQIASLFPFFDHQMASVRTSAVQCFSQLLASRRVKSTCFKRASCLIFFNLLTETKPKCMELNEEAWVQVVGAYEDQELIRDFEESGLVYLLFKLACTPMGIALDPVCLAELKDSEEDLYSDEKYIVGSQFASNAHQMRFAICRALSTLFPRLNNPTLIVQNINTSSATTRIVMALIGCYWYANKDTPPIPHDFHSIAIECPQDYQWNYLNELEGHKAKFAGDWAAFAAEIEDLTGQRFPSPVPIPDVLTMDRVGQFMRTVCSFLDQDQVACIAGSQEHVVSSAQMLIELQMELQTRVKASIASMQVASGSVPQKLNGIVQPLMGGIRTESEVVFQKLFADHLAKFILLCHERKAAVNKMVENICGMSSEMDTSNASKEEVEQEENLIEKIERLGINAALRVASVDALEDRPVAKRGADFVLKFLAEELGSEVFHTLPSLWTQMTQGLGQDSQSALHCFEVIASIGPFLDICLLHDFCRIITSVCELGLTQNRMVCISAARCCARLISRHTEALLPSILGVIIPSLAVDQDPNQRERALFILHHLLEALGARVTPYMVLLIIPLLSLMSDFYPSVQIIAASCFGKLMSFLPLVISASSTLLPPPNLTSVQQTAFHENSTFVMKLLDNKKPMDLQLPEGLGVNLREYQKEGISWMMFLRKFGLHGILADDMGLGKTIQTLITILLSKERAVKVLPSLVVCPATLMSHWLHEAQTLLPSDALRPINYAGAVGDRLDLRSIIDQFDLIIVSYETLRIDVEWLTAKEWDYCILDEGHIIRNYESKIWKACKRVNARYRLVLSGTPVQNGVLELWALFDFLMPGFLGTRKDFMIQYGKAVDSAKYAKKGSNESTSGILAVSSLHKRVTPFVMRRTKDEVLNDLPPKIIQDIYCDLSYVQKLLYEDFSRSQLSEDEANLKKSSFQSLQYLSRLCSHPLLAINWQDSTHLTILSKALGKSSIEESSTRDLLTHVSHTPKFQILQELFNECGITTTVQSSPLQEGGISPHRMLIFTQLRDLLTLVEEHLLLPLHIPYLRLDGSVPAIERGRIVHQFNSDPTINVLLLTNKVGGLGLNLTSADVVVFLEHDWNPMNDLQAMDRAHRLGQKRTVNVYRILTRGTLEEKIMSLQSFKLGVANSVVNKDNISLDSMDTSHLLDLFSYGGKGVVNSEEGLTNDGDEDFVEKYEKEFGKRSI
eukprot:g5043.t1